MATDKQRERVRGMADPWGSRLDEDDRTDLAAVLDEGDTARKAVASLVSHDLTAMVAADVAAEVAELRDRSRWRNAETEPPAIDGCYLTIFAGPDFDLPSSEPEVLKWREGAFWYECKHDNPIKLCPSHWMPLPKPPEGKR